jgi:hypothetical protein
LQAFGDELGVTASAEQFETTIQNATAQLQNRTAVVQILDAQVQDGRLLTELEVRSFVGHKLPSGFPSRRAWLHLVVRDAAGNAVFESGAYNERGAIQGNDNDLDPARYEPHYRVINQPDQVQIYEAIMVNSDSVVTSILLRAATYVKDNRVLPAGFDKTTAHPDFGVYGEAMQDETFTGGSDRIRYEIDLGGSEGPFLVEAELLYQTIGFRWAENLRQYGVYETERFLRYYDAVANLPTLISRAELKDIR